MYLSRCSSTKVSGGKLHADIYSNSEQEKNMENSVLLQQKMRSISDNILCLWWWWWRRRRQLMISSWKKFPQFWTGYRYMLLLLSVFLLAGSKAMWHCVQCFRDGWEYHNIFSNIQEMCILGKQIVSFVVWVVVSVCLSLSTIECKQMNVCGGGR